ncbi:MAG TPA: GntR family transcriptional regulator [Gaiellaceae bacterium]|nr:GntR family transcriptional regulator [Gaiellaceae bacterium]
MHQIVVEHLTDEIVTGNLPPGTKLSEPGLAATYGVSRGPVREALKLLEGNGLVRIVPGKGATVTKLTRDEIVETYDIRVELEGLGARIGMRHVDDPATENMGIVLEEMGNALDSPAEWMKLNDEFHMTLYATSGMTQLCDIILALMMKTRPYQYAYLSPKETLLMTHAEHVPLFEAVRRRDAETVEEITRAHLRRGAEAMIEMASAADR